MTDSIADTQPYLAEGHERSIGSISTTSSTKLNEITVSDNIPQKRPYISYFATESISQHPDDNNSNSKNKNNSSFDETDSILPDDFENPSPSTNAADTLSPYQYSLEDVWETSLDQQRQEHQHFLLPLLDSDSDEDDIERALHESSNRNNSRITGFLNFDLDEIRRHRATSPSPSNESQSQHQLDSPFGDSIRISDIEASDSDSTESPAPTRPPLNFMQRLRQQQQQSEHNNPPQQTTSNTQLKDPVNDDSYDGSTRWNDTPDLTGMALPDNLDNNSNNSDDTAPYDMNEQVDDDERVPYDMGGPVADNNGKNKATSPYDMDKPTGPLVHDDPDSVETVLYDVDGPMTDGDGKILATRLYSPNDSKEHVLDGERGGKKSLTAVLLNENGNDGLGVDITNDRSLIYDMDDFDIICDDTQFLGDDYRAGQSPHASTIVLGEHKSKTSYIGNDDDGGGFEQNALFAPLGLDTLEDGDRTSNGCSFVGDNDFVLDSQPESSYGMDDEYEIIGCNNNSSTYDYTTNMANLTHRIDTNSGSSTPPQRSISPRYNSMTTSLRHHDSSNESHHQENHHLSMSASPATTRLETLGQGTKSGNNNHSQQKKHQQTSIDTFYSQLSTVSSLSTAKSFLNCDDYLGESHTKNDSINTTPSFTSSEPELDVSCSPPRKTLNLTSLGQLRMEKLKKRQTLSLKKDEQWLPVSRNLSSSPPSQHSHSSLSESVIDQGKDQPKNDSADTTKKIDTPPSSPSSTSDQLICRPPPRRRRIIGLSKLTSSPSASTSIASMLGREHPNSNCLSNSSLQPTSTITKSSTAKSIPPRKKALGMLRPRAIIRK